MVNIKDKPWTHMAQIRDNTVSVRDGPGTVQGQVWYRSGTGTVQVRAWYRSWTGLEQVRDRPGIGRDRPGPF